MSYGYGFNFQGYNSETVVKMPETKITRGRRRCGMTSGMCCIRTTLVTFNLGTGVSKKINEIEIIPIEL